MTNHKLNLFLNLTFAEFLRKDKKLNKLIIRVEFIHFLFLFIAQLEADFYF